MPRDCGEGLWKRENNTGKAQSWKVCRFKDAEKRIAGAEDREHQFQQDIVELKEKLHAEKDVSATAIAAAEERYLQDADDRVSSAVIEAESKAAEAMQGLQSSLEAKELELQVPDYSLHNQASVQTHHQAPF